MVDFDSQIQNPATSTGGITSGGGTTPAPTTKPSIEDFFNRKLTRAQVGEEFGQVGLDMFDKANTDGEDGISKSEMDAYNNPEPKADDITSKSGKRTAVGGIYTVVKGDTLSKIANDFNIPLVTLYNINRNVIGNNMNLIEIGMQLHIKGSSSSTSPAPTTTKPSASTIDSSDKPSGEGNKDIGKIISEHFKSQISKTPPKLFAGMTREQAEKRGSETLQLFNQYAGADADKIDKSHYYKYTQTLDIKSPGAVISEIPAALGKDGKKLSVKDMGDILSSIVDQGSLATGIGRSEAGRELSDKVSEMILKYDSQISATASKEEIAERAAQLMRDIKTSAQDEIKNKGKLYNTHYERLKRGEFTDFEKACGLQAGDELTEEQLEKLTETAVKAEHIYPVLKTLAQAMQSQDGEGAKDNHIMLLIMDLGDQFFENQDVLAIAQMTGLMSVIDQAKQQFAANHIAETTTLSLEDMGTEASTLYTAVLADKADAQSFQVFAENHAESIDFINKVVNQVIQNSDNEDKNNALRQVMSNVNNKVGYTEGNTSASRGSSTSPTYTTNSIRAESERYYADLGITMPTTAEEVERQQSHQSVNKLKSEIGPAPVVYSSARIKQLAKDYNNSIGKFETLSPEDQEAIRKYLEGAMAQPQAIISIMLAGNEKVQLFLVKEKYISIEDIERNVKSFPSNFDSFSDIIKSALSKSVKESVMAGTLKTEQMTDGERKMYEYSNEPQI